MILKKSTTYHGHRKKREIYTLKEHCLQTLTNEHIHDVYIDRQVEHQPQ